MFITELAEPSLVVIYPGRFQPFHRGHHAVYEWLTGKFGRNNVYIATSNKQEGDRSPFSFAEKNYFMQLTGVPSDRIIQATQPYQIESIQQAGLVIPDPANTVVIFAVSEKDMAEDPRFSFRTKKDGSAPYFQPLKNIKDTQSMEKHAYIMTVPTFQFNVAGDPMQSATELRAEYRVADPQKKQLIIKDLFGRYTHEAQQIMDLRLPTTEPVQEGYISSFMTNPQPVRTITAKDAWKKQIRDLIVQYGNNTARLADLAKEKGPDSAEAYAYRYILNPTAKIPFPPGVTEEAAGVGVVRGGRDPRYMTATMGDQNDVNSKTLGKMMRAYNLVGVKAPKTQQTPVKKNVGTGIRESEDQEFQDDPGVHAEVNFSGFAPPTSTDDFLDKQDILYQILIDPRQRDKWPETKRRLTSLRFSAKNKGFLENREPYQQAIDRLSQAEIARVNDKIDRILARFATEKLPNAYKEQLKAEVEKLKDIRLNMLLGRSG